MLREKVASRSWHSSVLFHRTQASESPRAPSSETPPGSSTHTSAVPECPHPRAPLAHISTLDLWVASGLDNPGRSSVDPGIGAPLPPSIPSVWDPDALFCFPSGKPELIGVPVLSEGADSPPASTHPQEQQKQQQAQRVHGASGGTCPHRPPPAAAPGFQLVRSADR